MKKIYETPEAEVLDFASQEDLAIVDKSEDLGDDPTIEFVSRGF